MLQLLHISLGASIAAIGVHIVAQSTGSRKMALITGGVLALHPAIFLFEAYALYTTSVAFLIALCALLLTRARDRTRSASAVGFFVTLSAITMTRSVYHVGLLFVFLPLVFCLLPRPTRRQAITLALAVLLPLGWYTKNKVQYGFFGASSWYGMGLWRTALFGQDNEVLRDLYDSGSLRPVVRLEAFSPPSAYRGLGFDLTSDISVLARDDQQNVNLPAISKDYRASAVTLIKRAPAQYTRNVLTAYGNFSTPSTGFAQLAINRGRIQLHVTAQEWLLGRPIAARLEAWLGQGYYGSAYYLLFPAVLFLYLFQFTRNLGGTRGLWRRSAEDPAMLFVFMLVAYTILISSTMELGENVRFKFMIEPVFLMLLAVVAHRMLGNPPRAGATGEKFVADPDLNR